MRRSPRNRVGLLAGLLLLVWGGPEPHAQHVQVSLDETGASPCIEAEQATRVRTLREYSGIIRACLYRRPDASHVLTIHYRSGVEILRVDRELSDDELKALRLELGDSSPTVSETLEAIQAPQAEGSGRTRLLIGSTLLALGFYGWALPVALDVSDAKSFVAGYMLTSSAGFFVPFSLTESIPVSGAQATLSFYGGSRGVGHGMLISCLISGRHVKSRGLLGGGILTSVMGGFVGFKVAGNRNMQGGTAELIGLGGDLGAVFGLAAAHVAGSEFERQNNRLWCGSTLLGSTIGLKLGAVLARRNHYTRGDARALGTLGLITTFTGLAAVDVIDPEEERFYSGTMMTGMLAGLVAGHHLLRDKDFTAGQGTLLRLGTLSGALAGAGIAYLVASDNSGSATYTSACAIGGAAGFTLLYRLYAEEAEQLAEARHAEGPDAPGIRWSVGVSPHSSALTNSLQAPEILPYFTLQASF